MQIGGPTGAFIVIIYGIVQQYGVDGLMVATIMAGLMLVAMGLLRLGSIIKFMPYPIVVGFTSGIAVVIFSNQIRDLLGLKVTEAVPADFIEKWTFYAKHISDVNYWSAGIALFTILVVALWPKVNKTIPGTLIALILTTIAVSLFELPVETIGSRFGEIKAGIPAPTLPIVNFETFRMLLAPAFTIAILGAIESLLSAMVADGATGGRHRSNTELIGQGVANIVTPIFGGIPATGAIARTMTNIRNGGKTPVAGIIHSITLLLIMLFFGKWAKLVPMSTLAGILVMVAYNMSEWRSFRALLGNHRFDVAVLLVTFFLTVLIDLTVAIQFGLLLAVLLFLRRIIETSGVEVIEKEISEEDAEVADETSKLIIPEGVDVFEVNGPFFFGVASRFEEAERNITRTPRVRIVRLWRVPFMDATGVNNLRNFIRMNLKKNVVVLLSGANVKVKEALEKSGITDMVGKENLCSDINAAILRAKEIINSDLN